MNSELNGKVEKNDRCCGESGTLGVSRPDISTQVRFRKEEEMKKGVEAIRIQSIAAVNPGSTDIAVIEAKRFDGPVKILTSCPSCLQGLSRYEGDTGVEADYIVVEIARHLLGEDWLPKFVEQANAGGIERVLV
jgi:Fe-S oxidoreductase